MFKHSLGSTVYLVHDLDQSPRMVTARTERPGALSQGTTATWHHEIEVSDSPREKATIGLHQP